MSTPWRHRCHPRTRRQVPAPRHRVGDKCILSLFTPFEDLMLATFVELKGLEGLSFNYGKFPDFDQVRRVKDAMVAFAMDDEWFPVIT